MENPFLKDPFLFTTTNYILVGLRIRLISAELKPVLSHTENYVLHSITDNSMIFKIQKIPVLLTRFNLLTLISA